jgi:hypothetical protein
VYRITASGRRRLAQESGEFARITGAITAILQGI